MGNAERDFWYVGADEKGKPNGFTMWPDLAKKDNLGNPIICPADMSRVWKAQFRKDKAKQEAVWERLLDEMEKIFQLEPSAEQLDPDDAIAYNLSTGIAQGLREALALLTGQSVEAITKESEERYDQSTEG